MAEAHRDWDLNSWNWNGHLFVATPSRSSDDDDITTHLKRKADHPSLALNLGAKNTRLTGPICQVQDCAADLTQAKDYHRRHKVCQIHSKATTALVNNLMQRFCQQCSRFHLLQEFDEGKRSCRRRLAGHNKRRRKTQPDAPLCPTSTTHDPTNTHLLITLLRVLSNLHASNGSHQSSDQDLVAHLLTALANASGSQLGKPISGVVHESHKVLNAATNGDNGALEMQSASPTNTESTFPVKETLPSYTHITEGRANVNNFDLNHIYVDSDDATQSLETSPVHGNSTSSSLEYPPWPHRDSHQSSPPQTSINSNSASAHSPDSSSGEAPSPTDRIVFKLFGKEPSDLPVVLRRQILDWLAQSPTDIESYIRPGCIILTVYVRLSESMWDEICSDLSSCLTRLFNMSDDPFWSTGWAFVQVQNQIAFVHNGLVVLDTSLYLQDNNYNRILSVMPVAVSVGEEVQFSICGSNLSQSATRLLCALEGSYLNHDASQELGLDGDSVVEDGNDVKHASFSCIIPNVSGRGFIEMEDHGLSGGFFPFIVAEKDVCADIRLLERVLDLQDTNEDSYQLHRTSEVRRQAMYFLNEMGWLLHGIHLRSRSAHLDPYAAIFSFKRYGWLMDFSMDHDWCAVIKKLLDILTAGSIGFDEHPSLKVAVAEMGLLHRAVRRNYRPMVELLLRYVPATSVEEFTSVSDVNQESFMFRPDAKGPGGLTPLHVAAGRDGSEEILDALTNDPRKIGVEAWKNVRDSTGATPEDYARLRGHYAYIHMVQRKLNRKAASGHVVVDMPSETSCVDKNTKQGGATSFGIVRSEPSAFKNSCKLCDGKMAYYRNSRASVLYRPAVLSMVAVAAVCVCVALLFKSMPNVVCLFQPFRWEMLNYGSS